MKRRVAALVGLAGLVCMSTFSATAIGASEGRIPITDPNVLVSMGFPPNAPDVFRAANVAGSGMTDAQPTGDFGINAQYAVLAPKAFIGRQNTAATPWEYDGGEVGCCSNMSRTGPEAFADAQLTLPHGALLDGFRFWGNDTNAGSDLLFFVFEACYPTFGPGATSTTTISSALGTTGSSGYQSEFSGIGPTTIDNVNCVYTVRANFQATSGLTLQKIRFQWYRQISPAPGVASFTDVPTSAQFFQEVEALASSGITSGCTATTFCPDNFVTRRQMAAFLSRALGL